MEKERAIRDAGMAVSKRKETSIFHITIPHFPGDKFPFPRDNDNISHALARLLKYGLKNSLL